MSVRKRIGFFLSNFAVGGAERQYFNLIRGIDKRTFDVCVVFIQYLNNRPSQALLESYKSLDGVRVQLFERKHKADISVIWKVAKFVQENNIDILQSLLFMDNQIVRLAALLTGKPAVTSERGEIRPLHGWFKTWFEFRMQPFSKRIVVNSNWLKDDLVKLGSNSEKIVVIHNGIEAESFRSNAIPAAIRQRHGILPEAKVVGIVARLHPMKDHRTFFDSVRLMIASLPTVHAVVAGDGELREILRDYVREIGIENSVTFLGTVTASLPEVYRMMDVLLLTSQWGESFPNVVLEAMAASVPVVATNISAIPEIIIDGVNGYLVEKKNASLIAEKALALLTQQELRERFIKNGLARVGEFGVATMVKKYESLYAGIAERSV